jgi:hypothetical protein
MSVSSQVILTSAEANQQVSLTDAGILYVAADSTVCYRDTSSGFRKYVIVKETQAEVIGASDYLVSITLEDASVIGLNYVEMKSIVETDSKAQIFFDDAGASLKLYVSSDDKPTVDAAIHEKAGGTAHAYDAVDATTGVISIAAAEGDVTSTYTAGVVINLSNSDGGDGSAIYTVASSVHGANTDITVNETITDQTEAGFVLTKA